MDNGHIILAKDFYYQSTEEVARQLLGKTLVYQNIAKQVFSGIIVETEAYLGLKDPACHSFRGKITSRNKYLYQEGGYTYVYFIYGMYYCMNFVTKSNKEPEAVLIRAIEPQKGLAYMRQNRKHSFKKSPKNKKPETYLTSGPGKLCQAFGFDLTHNKLKLTQNKPYPAIYVLDASTLSLRQISKVPRIGIQSYGEVALWPLRFYIKDNPFVSALK